MKIRNKMASKYVLKIYNTHTYMGIQITSTFRFYLTTTEWLSPRNQITAIAALSLGRGEYKSSPFGRT